MVRNAKISLCIHNVIFGIAVVTTIIPFDLEQGEQAARLHPLVQSQGLSLADRACIALGIKLQIPIYWTLDKILSTKIGNLVLIIYFAVTWSLFKLYSLGVWDFSMFFQTLKECNLYINCVNNVIVIVTYVNKIYYKSFDYKGLIQFIECCY